MEKLHEMYSSSATVHLINERYGDTFVCIAKKIERPPIEVMRWKLAKQQIGFHNYKKLIKVYPELEGRIDYNNTYTPYGDYNGQD